MDKPLIGNTELFLCRKLAKAMGYEEDELNHPYRKGSTYELSGEQVQRLYDFNPVRRADDALRVQIFFNLVMSCDSDVIVVRDGQGPLLLIQEVTDLSADGRLAATCLALSHAAAILLVRTQEKTASVLL